MSIAVRIGNRAACRTVHGIVRPSRHGVSALRGRCGAEGRTEITPVEPDSVHTGVGMSVRHSVRLPPHPTCSIVPGQFFSGDAFMSSPVRPLPLALNDQIVLVTGGGRGLGAHIVRAFLAQGSRVVVNYLASGDAVSYTHLTLPTKA